MAKGLGVRIASVPEGKTPTSICDAKGAASFEAALAQAVDLVEFKTELLVKKESFPLSPEAKSSVAKQVLATIEQSPDEVLKAEWIRRLAQRLGVPEHALRKQGEKSAAPSRQRQANPSAPQLEKLSFSDTQFLELMFKQPSLAALGAENDFDSSLAKRVWSALSQLGASPDWAAKLLETLPEADRTIASQLLITAQDKECSEAIFKAAVLRRRIDTRLTELQELAHRGKLVEMGLQDEYYRLLTESRRTKTG